MSSSGYKGNDGKTYYNDGKNITVKDSNGATTWSGSTPNSGGGSTSKPVTDMNQWYIDTQNSQGYKPTADQVSAAMDSYKGYVAGKTNPNSGDVWNQYGEKIGTTGTGTGGYVDFSHQAANAKVNPENIWNREATDTQRTLTSTPLLGKYLNYGNKAWEAAPASKQKGGIGFIDHNNVYNLARKWLDANPNSLWDEESLGNLWKGEYEDISKIPQYFNRYADEFKYSGATPTIEPPQMPSPQQQQQQHRQPAGQVQAGQAGQAAAAPQVFTAPQMPVSAPVQSGGGTPTTIILPSGNSITGYINNGRTTLADGTPPPIGSKVQTAAGWYEMTPNGGVAIGNSIYNNAPVQQSTSLVGASSDLASQLVDYIMKQELDMRRQEEMFNYNAPEMRSILGYDEATAQARAMYGSQFKLQRDKELESLQADLTRRGLFGQLDATALEQSTAAQLLDAENSQIAQITQMLIDSDRAAAYQQNQQAMQQWESLNNLRQSAYSNASTEQQQKIANIMALLTLSDQQKRDDFNMGQTLWERGVTEAGLTGNYNGLPLYGEDLNNRLKEAQIKNLERSANAPYGGGGSGYSTSQQIDDLMKIWQITGKAPAGLEGFGVTSGTPFGGQETFSVERLTAVKKAIQEGKVTRQEAIDEINSKVHYGEMSSEDGQKFINGLNPVSISTNRETNSSWFSK